MAVHEWQLKLLDAEVAAAPQPLAHTVVAQDPAWWLQELDSLDAALRAADFAPTPDRWINVADLLTQLLAVGALPRDCESVARYLAPLFSRSRIEQERFSSLLRAWWHRHAPASGTATEQPAQTCVAPAAVRGLAWLGWRSAAVVLALLVAGAGSTFLYFELREAAQVATTQAVVAKSTKILNDVVVADERAAIKALRPREPAETSFPAMPAPSTIEPRLGPIATGALQLLNVLAFAVIPALVLLVLWRSWLGQLVLRRGKADPDRPPKVLWLQLKRDALFDGSAVRTALKRLHTPVAAPTRRLDVERTMAATVRRAGLFSPVRALRSYVPEVLLWVHSRGHKDPVQALANTLLERLRACDLTVVMYSYRAEPDLLLAQSQQRWQARGEVLAQHAGSRLIVVGDAEGLIDVWSSTPLPWVVEAAAQCEMLLLEPSPRSHEFGKPLGEAGVLLAPLSSAGVERAIAWSVGRDSRTAHTPRPLPALLRDAERLRMPVALPREQADELLATLRRYLGVHGIRLLTAAAVYPEFRWELVRALDAQLYPDDADAAREARLLQVAQLPWSRDGWLPDWLRLLLLRQLAREQRRELRAIYEPLLREITQKVPENVALPVHWPKPSQALHQHVRELFKWGPHPGVLEDAVLVEFILGGRFSRLDFELTRAWERLLPGASLRSARGRAIVAFASIVLALLSGASWLQWGAPGFQRQFGLRDALKNVPLTVVYNAGTAQLTQQLQRTLLGTFVMKPALETIDSLPGTFATLDAPAVLIHRADWQAPAEWLAQRIGYASYGAPVLLLPSDDARAKGVQLADRAMQLWLRRPNQLGHVFSDTLSRPFSKQAWEQALKQPTPVQTVQAPEVTPEPPSGIALSAFRDKLADGSQGPVMVVMPAGKFLMGSPNDEPERQNDEGPQHQVTIRAFALSQTEVTFEDYDRFAKATNRKLPDDEGWGRVTRPVINVSWRDATAYAEWLSRQTGQMYRLPTEAEWEYAARAGTRTPFNTGKCISGQQANFRDLKEYAYEGCPSSNQWVQKTQPVGVFPANQFGLRDMHGNAWEWVEDCLHENYVDAPTDGSAWLEPGKGDCSRRVLRGGSWSGDHRNLRSAYRDRYTDDGAYIIIGFRLARTL